MSYTCEELEVIPQYIGSCWFNAILMSVLYSQGSRKIMIETLKKNKKEKENSTIKIIKNILKNYGKKNKLKQLYKKIRPELLLLKILKQTKDTTLKANLKKDFAWYSEYINRFYRFLGVKCVDIIYDYKDKKTLINFENKITYKRLSKSLMINYDKKTYNSKKETDNIKKIIKEVPDVIILFHSGVNEIVNDYSNFYKNYFSKIETEDIYDLNKYKCKISGIDKYEDIIDFNGHKYKLDSCIIDNYNKTKIGHSITGITCKGNKYVYNGWTRKTIDPALNNANMNDNYDYFPCSLMKFDWDLKKSNDFCLNPVKCKLDFVTNKKDLCFNFNKGNRILIYTREDKKEKTLTVTSNTTPSKISDISSILKSFKDIKKNKKLSQAALIKKIKELNIHIDKTKEYDLIELRNFYIKQLKKFYNISSSSKKEPKKEPSKEPKKEPSKEPKKKEPTRLELIEMIKKKYSKMRGLTTKRKDELIAILNEKEPSKEPKKKEPTRLELIEMIKKKYSKMRGLTAKRKDELIAILNKS